MNQQTLTFEGKLWRYAGAAAWHFITLPPDVAQQLRFFGAGSPGFGSVRVGVAIGQSQWKTSVFPDKASGSYLLPVKAEVRKREMIGDGDSFPVLITLS